jgi:hypothetical protein
MSPDAGGSTIHSLYRAWLEITTSSPSFWENLRGGPACIHSADQLIRHERYLRLDMLAMSAAVQGLSMCTPALYYDE